MSTPATPDNRKSYVYDVECYTNYFTAGFEHVASTEEHYFEIYHDMHEADSINQYTELIAFLTTQVRTLVGYNNVNYDDMLLKHLIINEGVFKGTGPRGITGSTKGVSDKIIGSKKFSFGYKQERDPYIDTLTATKRFGSLDLLRQFNTIDRVSLKQIAVNMRWPLIIDLPKPPSYLLTTGDLPEMRYYHRNDVKITKELLRKREEPINQRRQYGLQQKANVLNANDTNIAKYIIRKYYAEFTKKPVESFTGEKSRTYYKTIKLYECISPRIHFITETYNKALNLYRNATINPNRLSAADEKALRALNKKRGWKGTKQFEYILQSDVMTHTLGVGGIHSNNVPAIYEETEDYEYIDIDAKSFYPSILIQDGFYPTHLGREFLTVYRDFIYYPRLKEAASGNKVGSEMLKKALNSTFGLTKSQHSWLYDPKVTMSTTVSGQLYLMMLMEAIEHYSHCKVIYSNTDGLTTKVPKGQREMFLSICKQWEQYTGFVLSYTNIKKIVIRDINNFMIFDKVSKEPIKTIGVFLMDKPITAGYEFPVITKALYECYTNDIRPEVTIKSCTNIYDFMVSQRSDTTKFVIRFRAQKDNKITEMGKVNRWIVTSGNPEEGKLIRHSRGKASHIIQGHTRTKQVVDVDMQEGYLVTMMNDLTGPQPRFSDYKINYDFYIRETLKIIRDIKPREVSSVRTIQKELF